jgi:hypothetical protein
VLIIGELSLSQKVLIKILVMFGENRSVHIQYFLDISKDPDNSNVLYFRSDAPAYWLGYQTYNDLQV